MRPLSVRAQYLINTQRTQGLSITVENRAVEGVGKENTVRGKITDQFKGC